MREIRVFVEQALHHDSQIEIDGQAAQHVTRVLRLRVGAVLTAFDGRGGEYTAELAAIGKRRITLTIGEHHNIERESALEVTLLQGVARGERMDFIIQKATELGVSRIVPLVTTRSVVQLEEERSKKRLDHWRAVAAAACEQSGRNRLPDIAPACSFAVGLAAATDGSRFVLSPTAALPLCHEVTANITNATILIGPEGGLDESELAQALAHGFQPRRLGPRVLRTETAALAALAVLQSAAGDLS